MHGCSAKIVGRASCLYPPPLVADSLRSSSPIDHRLFDQPTAGRIVARVAVPLSLGWSAETLAGHLNDLIRRALRRIDEPCLTSLQFKALRDHYEGYVDSARALQSSDNFPPLPPLEWHRSVEAWISDTAEGFEARAKGGRRTFVRT